MRKLQKTVYVVFQDGFMDYVGMDLSSAKEMAISPSYPYSRDFYRIERWKLDKNDKYVFDKVVQHDKELVVKKPRLKKKVK